MKKIMITMAMIALAASCTKNIAPDTDTAPVAIVPSAGLSASSAETRAAITGTHFTEGTGVCALSAYVGAAASLENYNTAHFDNVSVNSDNSGILTLSETKYFLEDKTKELYFFAYAPVQETSGTGYVAGSAAIPPKVNFTLTGQEDILHAAPADGIAKATSGQQTQPALAFTHKLQLLKFTFTHATGFDTTGVTVTSVTVGGMKTKPVLDLKTGVLDWTNTATDNFSITLGGHISTVPTQTILTQPVKALPLTVVTSQGTYSLPDFKLDQTPEAGKAYTINLKFTATGIVPTATITDWTDGGTTDGNLL